MPSYPGFLGPAYQSQSYIADSEVLLNWLLEKNESDGAPNPYVMLPTPGLNLFASVTESPIRGSFYQNGRAFFVAGTVFYELFADGTTTNRGTVAADANPVTINANGDAGNQLWITSGGVGYIFNLGTNALSIQGPAGATVSMGGFLSARFLALDSTTGIFYASALYDGTSWDPLAVAQNESGDPWRALVVTPDNLIRLIGESSGDCYANQGAPPPMPFTKIQEASTPFGISAPFAWTVDTAVSWLAQNKEGRGLIVRAPGYQPERISTHAIETAIHGYDDLSDVTAFSYIEHGHSFVLFTFPSAEATWVYDLATRLWHQRDYWDSASSTSMAYRPTCTMEAFGTTIVGDRLSGSLYEMGSEFQTDVGGAPIRRVRQPPRLSMEQKRLTIPSLELVMDKGQGTATGQGVNPVMMLEVSRDGGKTFGNQRQSSSGAGGAFEARVRWTNCGQARNFVPRFIASDPVPFPITDCVVNVRVGTS